MPGSEHARCYPIARTLILWMAGRLIRYQKAVAILAVDPRRLPATTAPGRAGFGVPIFGRGGASCLFSRSAGASEKNIRRIQAVFGDSASYVLDRGLPFNEQRGFGLACQVRDL